MITKHVLYEIDGPEEEKDAAFLRAVYTMEWKMTKETGAIRNRSDMSYVYANGSHQFCIAIEVEEAA